MLIRGDKIMEDAFALIGAYSPGTKIEDEVMTQGLRFANSKIEELNQRSSQFPGTTIQDLELTADRDHYWLGPTAGTPMLPGLKTSGAPDVLESAAFVTEIGGDPLAFPRSILIAENAVSWGESRGLADLVLWLRTGPGIAAVDQMQEDSRAYADGNRKLEVFPAASGFLRLYMRVPEVQFIAETTVYDLPPGVHRTLTTNIADALTTVFGADAQTVQDLHAQAAAAAGAQQKKNLRGRRPAAHLPDRWITTVSDDYRTYVTERG